LYAKPDPHSSIPPFLVPVLVQVPVAVLVPGAWCLVLVLGCVAPGRRHQTPVPAAAPSTRHQTSDTRHKTPGTRTSTTTTIRGQVIESAELPQDGMMEEMLQMFAEREPRRTSARIASSRLPTRVD
jgi:hypothetical protein